MNTVADTVKTRACKTCGLTYPEASYGRLNTRQGIRGRNPNCKPCLNAKERWPRTRWSNSKAQARQAGLDFTIPFELFVKLIASPCFYCGGPLAETGRGMDRADTLKGYTPENVVPCCAICNQMKNIIFTMPEMQRLGAVVRSIREERAKRGEPLLSFHMRGGTPFAPGAETEDPQIDWVDMMKGEKS